MIRNNIIWLFLSVLLFSCGYTSSQHNDNVLINSNDSTLEGRFSPPGGFVRDSVEENSFAAYLRVLPLKPDSTEVMLYNGETKKNRDIYDAVVDLKIGDKDLQQCADAVIRLRAEYLWRQKQYDKIHFNFTSGFRCGYSEWMKGRRVTVNGNEAGWVDKYSPSNTYKDFWNYLEIVFSYAGTLSLSKELTTVYVEDMKIGDVFIQGGSPGHAVIVVDMAVNPDTKEKLFMLAQSYMPAQEIQILKNPGNEKISPWYSLGFGDVLKTPEWTFYKKDLKRFQE